MVNIPRATLEMPAALDRGQPAQSDPERLTLTVPETRLNLRGGVVALSEMPALVPQWQDLCRRSIEDNVYYSPQYVRALLQGPEQGVPVMFAVVWSRSSLVALLPVVRSRFPVPLLRAGARAWESEYTYNCTPILDAEQSQPAAGLLLDVLAALHPGEWAIPWLNIEKKSCQSLVRALDENGFPWTIAGRFERASMDTGETFEAHMRAHMKAKRRSELGRNRRRLEQLGTVRHAAYTSGEPLRRAVEDFLRIEASGWKGRRGTALACDEATRRFAMLAFAEADEKFPCRADVLYLEDTAIAASLTLLGGRTGYTVKCAYDEAYRSCAAGLLLEVDVLRSFLTERWASRLDAGTAGSHVVDGLWSGRVPVGDLLFSLAPDNAERRLAAWSAVDRARRASRAELKRLAAGGQQLWKSSRGAAARLASKWTPAQ